MTDAQRPPGAGDISCLEFVEAVTNYLEGTLDVRDRARLDAHLDECEACSTYLDQLRITLREVGRIPHESLSDAAGTRLRVAFADWSRER